MTLVSRCIVIAAMLPYVAALVAKARKRHDNPDPRGWPVTY
jgi:uncharacterized MAPEG superfamily protein